MEHFRAINDRFRGDASIKSGELSFVRIGERQKINVGNVSGVQNTRGVHAFPVKQRYVVRPEAMPGQFSERNQQLGHDCRRTGTIRISRMSNNTQNPIFGHRASRPSLVPFCRKPAMRALMQHVSRIDQGDQNVHVQKVPRHGISSSSRRTSSEVTLDVPGRTASSGIPLRVG